VYEASAARESVRLTSPTLRAASGRTLTVILAHESLDGAVNGEADIASAERAVE
jgi:hypothetical protein